MEKSEKVFRSRVSVLLLGIVLAVTMLTAVAVAVLDKGEPAAISIIGGADGPTAIFISSKLNPVALLLMGGIWALGILFAVFLVCGIRYAIEGGKLRVKVWMIPFGSTEISDIVSAERSYDTLSSPAASLKRLRLGLRTKKMFPFVLVSPAREEEFIEALKAVNPDIEVRIPPPAKGWWRIQDWDI